MSLTQLGALLQNQAVRQDMSSGVKLAVLADGQPTAFLFSALEIICSLYYAWGVFSYAVNVLL